MKYLLVLLMLVSPLASADCFNRAAKYYHVNHEVLRAIAQVESSLNPNAIRKNKNGSVDRGLMQINSIHLPLLNKYGIHKKDLMDGCSSIYVGAYLLKRSVDRYGNTLEAIGSYHSATPGERDKYTKLVVNRIVENRRKNIIVTFK